MSSWLARYRRYRAMRLLKKTAMALYQARLINEAAEIWSIEDRLSS